VFSPCGDDHDTLAYKCSTLALDARWDNRDPSLTRQRTAGLARGGDWGCLFSPALYDFRPIGID
jgi:hypothetical protein